MKQKKAREEGEHDVTITITIAKASLTADHENKKHELPQVQNYFHCQYKLLPDDRETTRIDVVTYGVAAKMYGDNDTKILRTWLEGNKTWMAWASTRKLRVTQESLLKIFNHTFELRVWDTKDKVSPKARFDRPKAFRLPLLKNMDEVDMRTIRSMLKQEGKTNVHLGAGILSESDLDFETNTGDEELGQKMSMDKSPDKKRDLVNLHSESHLEVQVALDQNMQPMFKNLMSLASAGINPLAIDTIEAELEETKPVSVEKKSRSRRARRLEAHEESSKKTEAELEMIQKNGLACITIPLSAWFTNATSISSNMETAVGSLQEVIVILSVDEPLLSERQRQVLNPMVLTIGSATQMPDNLMNFKELRRRCVPPYLKYKFLDGPDHIATVKQQSDILKFNNRKVILLGVMNKDSLFEFLRGPHFKVEIHDRDPKNPPRKTSTVFGEEEEDARIWSVTYTGSKNKSEESNCSYGIAEFDLSQLLQGDRIIQLVSPIRNHKKPAPIDVTKNLGLLAKNTKEIKEKDIPHGYYLEYGSDLKLKVELARSLLAKDVQLTDKESRVLTPTFNKSHQCPYNRMVMIFDYRNKSFLGKILSEIIAINGKALNLNSFTQHVIEAALSTYRLSDAQKADSKLDVITGCQVIDSNFHIFILEGLANEGIALLWEKLEHPRYNEDSFFRVLYNSGIAFKERLYIDLNVDLTRVKIYQPLANIVTQPLLYVRDMLPKLCFDAVTRLFQLCQCTSIQSAVRNEILPTAEMIVSLAKEFGVPLIPGDLHDDETQIQRDANGTPIGKKDEQNVDKIPSKNKTRVALDMTNEAYEELLEARKRGDVEEKDHIVANIKSLLALSKERSRQETVCCDTLEVAHNYSTQTLNSTAMANEKLREILAKDKNARYTYCKDYNSATIVPVSVEQMTKNQEKTSKESWQTKQGFTYPGVKSSKESNKYPKQLPDARLEEISLPWRENVLHTNKLKPTVDRLVYKWPDRHLNFDTLTKKESFFGQPMPVTIHNAGDTLHDEIAEAKERERKIWQGKLVAEETRFKTHRCLPATELTSRGPKASNQIDKRTDLLKDPPKKITLTTHNPIPSFGIGSSNHTIFDPDDYEKRDKLHPGFTPGELEGVSWSRNKNIVPLSDYQHAYFEKTKGQEFRLVHTDREKVAMKISQLSKEERDTHLFKTAQNEFNNNQTESV